MKALDTLRKRSVNDNEQAVDKEVTITFSGEVYEMLEEIARKKCKSVAEVIEDALGLERWYQKTREEGARVIVEGKNGDKWEIVQD